MIALKRAGEERRVTPEVPAFIAGGWFEQVKSIPARDIDGLYGVWGYWPRDYRPGHISLPL